MPPTVKPNTLRRGDKISVVAPAGPVDRAKMERAFARIAARGFHLKTYGDLYRSHGYLAGDDATRAQELMAAFADPETAAVWCARGGYGVLRILDQIDFSRIAEQPKVFIGFSDITLLHLTIQQRTGLITFHGPNLQDGFGKPEDMPAANEASLWQAFSEPDDSAVLDSSAQNGYVYNFENVEVLDLQSVSPGIATGQLTGGNLAVISSVVGTPFEIETAGRILFLEDIGERAYRLDRYLAQLKLAGKLANLAGVLLGSFSFDKGDKVDSQADIQAVFKDYFGHLGIPVLAGFPAGHDRYNLALPIGAQLKIDSDNKRVTVCESLTAG